MSFQHNQYKTLLTYITALEVWNQCVSYICVYLSPAMSHVLRVQWWVIMISDTEALESKEYT